MLILTDCWDFATGAAQSGSGTMPNIYSPAPHSAHQASPPASNEHLLNAAAAGRHIETIELQKADKKSLGFSVVGLRSEHRGELGIFVQEVQPGGIAHQ